MSPATTMVTIEDVRALARRRYDRDSKRWAADSSVDEPFDVALHPPTEVEALRDQARAIAWARSWRSPPFDAEVVWEQRRWASVGTQAVPVRVILHGAASIAAAAQSTAMWAIHESRTRRIRDAWHRHDAPDHDARLTASLRTEANRLLALLPDDFERFVDVVSWLVAHPASGLFVRQLPIRGVDTKWIGLHERLVRTFVLALTGEESLGLADNPSLIRVRILDPALAPGGLTDLAAPATQLASLTLTPDVVFVFENLESVVAMPPMAGAVVVHGSGYAVDRLRDIPWIAAGRVVYWGDLDSHGFAILHQARGACADVTSTLMDTSTFEAHRDLSGVEPTPNRGAFGRLTGDEQAMLLLLRQGDRRLEQERIEWSYALNALQAFVR